MIDAFAFPLGRQPLFFDCVIAVALYPLLLSVPFQIVAHILLFIGKMRTEHIESNIFHRAFEFCEKTVAGRVLLGLALFSPTLLIFVTAAFLCPGHIVATLPWLLSSLAPLLELRYQRRYTNGQAEIVD